MQSEGCLPDQGVANQHAQVESAAICGTRLEIPSLLGGVRSTRCSLRSSEHGTSLRRANQIGGAHDTLRRMVRPSWSHLGQRPRLTACVIYCVTTCVYLLTMRSEHLRQHTPYNHFALVAQAWLEHRLDLGGPPPLYANGNDFALYQGRWFVVFPPAPALLILPWVAMAGAAVRTLDGLFFAIIAGLAPAGMFLALDRLRRERYVNCGSPLVMALVALHAFGTVYFFIVVQGTVWFAAHVVAGIGVAFFLYCAIAARYPFGAGLALSLAIASRPTLMGLVLFFLIEWWRVAQRSNAAARHFDYRRLVAFLGPLLLTLGLLGWLNRARFGDPFEFGYRYLVIVWQTRIEKWGLFGYHYLARNLGVMLTNMPYLTHGRDGWQLQINAHGLALWCTTPLFLWLLYPRAKSSLSSGLYWSLGAVAIPPLLYQNTGWVQFGQRFSSDYTPILILLLALGGYRWNRWMKSAWVVSVAVNLFGALTFERAGWSRFYFVEPTQRIIYQPD